MRMFNIQGNTYQSEFETFFKGVIYFLEFDGTGAHYCHHIDGKGELVGAFTYMSYFISVEDITRVKSAYLVSKGRSYKVSSTCILACQFSPNQEHQKMATMLRGKLGMKHKIQNRNA